MTTFHVMHPYLALGNDAPAKCWRMEGNFHVHDSNAAECLGKLYADEQWRFLAISQHSRPEHAGGKPGEYSNPEVIRKLGLKCLTVLSGLEVELREVLANPSSNGFHFLHIKPELPNRSETVFVTSDHAQPSLDDVATEGLVDSSLVIAAHPSLQSNEFSIPQLIGLACAGLNGMEIWNHSGDALVRGKRHHPDSTDKWDGVLASGQIIWGFADDDFIFGHSGTSFKTACNVVWTPRHPNQYEVLKQLKDGCFFASTGILLANIAMPDRQTIEIYVDGNIADNSLKCFAICETGNGGKVAVSQKTAGPASSVKFTYKLPAPSAQEPKYVRFEVERTTIHAHVVRAWTQPFLTDKWVPYAPPVV